MRLNVMLLERARSDHRNRFVNLTRIADSRTTSKRLIGVSLRSCISLSLFLSHTHTHAWQGLDSVRVNYAANLCEYASSCVCVRVYFIPSKFY